MTTPDVQPDGVSDSQLASRRATEPSDAVPDKTILRLQREILAMIHAAGTGHPGGSLSVVRILAQVMLATGRFGPGVTDPDWLVLAKGHAAPALYAVLTELGYLDTDELATYRQPGSRLQGHPDRRKAPGVQVTTGHLGQGLSIGLGIALGLRRQGTPGTVWAVLGEGDLHEGQSWEAAMAARQLRASNLVAVLDANGLTQHGPVDEVMDIEPIAARFEAFGWHAAAVDGRDQVALARGLEAVRDEAHRTDGPALLIARTVKGQGVGFMERVPQWHSRGLSDAELAAAELALVEGRA